MATPRARGGMSLTILPPIRRSPLVCCSSPQMMRRNVVLPQPDGPSSTMNSPSGTVSEMPLTAGTSPNFLTISLACTADIDPPRNPNAHVPTADFSARCLLFVEIVGCGPRARRGPHLLASGSVVPLLEDCFALLRGLLDCILGGHLAG